MSESVAARFRIDNFNDTFALGHYARVMDVQDLRDGQTLAFKLLRSEHLAPDGQPRQEYRAFANEAQILAALAESPHAVALRECGYLSCAGDWPAEGEMVSLALDVDAFVAQLEEMAERNWRPWLALENLPRTRNLLYLMKPGRRGQRRRLPSEEGISLALQFAAMLRLAHGQGIVYLDHKLEHVYWDGLQLQVIDFNSSRQMAEEQNLASQIRTDLHNLCVGILYPVFTGLAPQPGSLLRPRPGTRRDIEERYRNIRKLDFGAEPTLSAGIRELLQRGAAGELADVDAFLTELEEAGAVLGQDFPERYTNPASREARDQLRAGLESLRGGHESLRAARERFREAAILEGISPDLEGELRRLVRAVNDMLNQRVIP